MVQIPVVSREVGEQTEGVVDTNATESPEDAVAVKLKPPVSSWLPGFTNVTVCAAAVTENDCDTGSAAA